MPPWAAPSWSIVTRSFISGVLRGWAGLVREDHAPAAALVGGAGVERLVGKGVEDRPGDIGVADRAVASRDVGDAAPAAGERRADRHQGLHNVGPPGVEFEAL